MYLLSYAFSHGQAKEEECKMLKKEARMTAETAAFEREKAAELLDEARAETASLRETAASLQQEVTRALERAGAAEVCATPRALCFPDTLRLLRARE